MNNYSLKRALELNESKLQPTTNSWGMNYLRSKENEVYLILFKNQGG